MPLAAEPEAEADADPDAEEPDVAGVVDELLHALATPSVSTATAAVPYRHRLPVILLADLTCSCLLTSKSTDDPGYARPPAVAGAAPGRRAGPLP